MYPNRDNDGHECSPPKKFREADEASDESMETHAPHDDKTSEHEQSDTKSSITTENGSEEEIDPWTTLIEASKVLEQYNGILQVLIMEGYGESKAKQEFLNISKGLGDVFMDNVAWMETLKKDPIHKKIVAIRDDYVNNDMFDPNKAMAAAMNKRKFLLKRLLDNQESFLNMCKREQKTEF